MPIDVDVPQSDGWWLDRLYKSMHLRPVKKPANGAVWETRAQRLDRLWSYYEGNPPLPEGAESAREAVRAFQRKARANYAALCVEAELDRMKLLGVRTVEDNDVNGDDLARKIADANGFAAVSKQVHLYRAVMGEGYAMLGAAQQDDVFPVMTAEDPRQCITIHDPARPTRTRAGLKFYRDEDLNEDVAHLFLPGRVRVATRPGPAVPGVQMFGGRDWTWQDDRSGDLTITDGAGSLLVPLFRFQNRNGMGCFEKHVDALDRINHQILQRVVIAVMQAFRQRAIKGELPDEDENGNKIDYDALFPADPGALWQLPGDVEMWESSPLDLSPILAAIRDDAREFAACTRTPLYYMFPDAANGSAEGASLMREGLTYRVEDSIELVDPTWLAFWRAAFLFHGDAGRAKGDLSTMWAPVERFSLAERADAAVKARASGVPQRSILSDIWQFDPATVKRMEEERLTDALLAPDLQIDAATGAPQPGRQPQPPREQFALPPSPPAA